jgi:hypothetical protein
VKFPLLSCSLFLERGLLERGHDLLIQAHADRVVVGPGGGGVHADQGQVDLAASGSLGDDAFQERLEDAGVPPTRE